MNGGGEEEENNSSVFLIYDAIIASDGDANMPTRYLLEYLGEL